ncbi:MAG TPA: TraR/DksA C4-type zinc finger protein [Acidimicrobiia bacterium]|nr:TraR/DksA C4-type zinc finger protein [Acidimicrobiia bacterium]
MSDEIRGHLDVERARADAQLAALTREFDAIVAAAAADPPDDEHDPDGATIGFERAQLQSLIDTTRQRRSDLDAALARLEADEYGRCERCGAAIPAARLAAIPTATRCVICAADTKGRRRAP